MSELKKNPPKKAPSPQFPVKATSF